MDAPAEPRRRRNPWWIPPFLGRVPAEITPGQVRLLGVVALALFFENHDLSMLGSALEFIREERRAGRAKRPEVPQPKARGSGGSMARLVRPSTTESTVALWAKSFLQALVGFAVFIVALPALAHWLLPQRVPLPFGLRAVAVGVLFVGGITVWAVCLDVFSRRGRGTAFPLDAPRHLVSSGPFAVVRNPIIVGEQAVLWSAALYLSSLGALLYAALVAIALHTIVVYVEEPELRKRFGEEYEAYCRRVPRWLPRFSSRARGG